MSALAKRKEKLQARMGALRDLHGNGKCWVCESTSGVKMSREGYGTRCAQCLADNRTSDPVEAYNDLKAQYSKIKDRT